MSKFVKCPNRINACPGTDPPFENLSAEETDPVNQIYFDVNPVNPPPVTPNPPGTCPEGYYLVGNQCLPYTPPEEPPIFRNLEQTGWVPCADGSKAHYTVPANVWTGSTQDEANANALDAAIAVAKTLCPQIPPVPPPPGPTPVPPTVPPTTFTNENRTKTVYCPDGTSSSHTVPWGSYPSWISVDDANAKADAEASRVATKNLICINDLTANICVDYPYTGIIIAKGSGLKYVNAGSSNATWALAGGTLPNGLHLSSSISIITGDTTDIQLVGIPTQTGTFTFSLKVSTASHNEQTKTFSIKVVGISQTSPLTMAPLLLPYSLQFTQYGMTGTITWEIEDATKLPPGMNFDVNTGILSGAPSEFGTYTFTINVLSTVGGVVTKCSKTFVLLVDCAGTVVLEPNTTAETVLATYNYGDVTQASFTETVAINIPAGTYRFVYISGAYIQYQQTDPPYYNVYTSSGYDSHTQDYLTFVGGTTDIPWLGPPDYNLALSLNDAAGVALVEARDAGRTISFITAADGDVTLTYTKDPIASSQNVGDNSVWELRGSILPSDDQITDILIGDFPAGDYILHFYEGAGNYVGDSLWNTRGDGDEILDAGKAHLADVPNKADAFSAVDAETDAIGDEITVNHTGGNMYWRLNSKYRLPLPVGKPPFATWKLCVAPP
jgi:hypothetical protein